MMARRMMRKHHVRCRAGEKPEITSKAYLSLSTVLRAMIEMFNLLGKEVLLTAPTGRAAKRISELTGYEAKTIHRLLEVNFTDEKKMTFIRDAKYPLECDVVIVDEMSMVDTEIFSSLLEALPVNCHLVMVGDSDQLPSVGAGNVLKDLIDSNKVPSVRLNKIFRQAQQSLIITNAHRIISGQYPCLTEKKNNFFFFRRLGEESACDTICQLATNILPKSRISPDDIQILCPMRKGHLGVEELNLKIQNIVNPSENNNELRSFLYSFREGDRVMQTKNDYQIEWYKDGDEGLGIFNGDIGKILEIDRIAGILLIDFDGRIVKYPRQSIENLELAYAITVHKSQGCEFPIVIIPLLSDKTFNPLYFINLLYTAVQRAKKMLLIEGRERDVFQMVDNNYKTYRETCLCELICNA